MKKPIVVVPFLFVFLLSAFSLNAGDKFANWPQLKSFHQVLSQTFHPSEEGNLEPIRKRSSELAEKARILANAPVPKEFDKKEVTDALKKLTGECDALDKMIQAKEGDDEVKRALSALHDTFHTIVEKCQPGDHHHHHHGEGHDHKH